MKRHDKNLIVLFAIVLGIFLALNFGLFLVKSPTGMTVSENLPPQWIAESSSFSIATNTNLVLDLNNYFMDDPPLTFVATEPSNSTVVLSDNLFTIIFDPGFIGTRQVSLTASDGEEVLTQVITIDVFEPAVTQDLAEITDANDKFYGKKVIDEDTFETYFSSVDKNDTHMTVVFYHDSETIQDIWLEGNVSYFLSADSSSADEQVTLVVQLIKGIVPKFKLHIGPASEVFEFGKEIPEVYVIGGEYELIDRDDELLDVQINKENISAVIKGTDANEINAKAGIVADEEIKTSVFAADNVSMEEAVITLPAGEDINAVFECIDFDIDTFTCPGGWQETDIPIEKNDSSITFTVNHFSGYGGGTINIINLQSYPTINGNWTVAFNVTGTENLTIIGSNGTNFSLDVNFLELKCGNTTIAATYDFKKVFYPNFSCNTTAYETSRVLTYGKHHLKFIFGNSTAYAHNLVVIGSKNVTNVLNATFLAENPADSAGKALALGDIDGDGDSDAIIGAPNRNQSGKSYRGKVYLVYGKFKPKVKSLKKANAAWLGANPFSFAGFSATLADFNNDSKKDIVIGSYGDNSSGVFRSGSVYIINGGNLFGNKVLGPATANHVFMGLNASGGFGFSVAAGDLNNDSILDLAVGEPALFSDNGTVYVFFGPFGGVVNSSSANVTIVGTAGIDLFGMLGASLAVGDFNGDGADDLHIGASNAFSPGPPPAGTGAVFTFYGPLAPGVILDTSANITFRGEFPGDLAGYAVSSGEDVNNDTFDDLLIGAPKYDSLPPGITDNGKVYLVYGNASFNTTFNLLNANVSWFGEALNDSLGISVLLSDEDNDTLADVVMGAPGNDFGGIDAGRVYFRYAPIPNAAAVNVSTVNGSLYGAVPGSGLGTSYASGSSGAGGPNMKGNVNLGLFYPYVEAGSCPAGGVYLYAEPIIPPPPPPGGSPPSDYPPGPGGTPCSEVEIVETYVEPGFLNVILDFHNYLDAVSVASPELGTSVSLVRPGPDGTTKVMLPFDPALFPVGRIRIIVQSKPPGYICTEEELEPCYGDMPEEIKFKGFENDFYEKDFSMMGMMREEDNKLVVYFNSRYAKEGLPPKAELDYCAGLERKKAYADIKWVDADGYAMGTLEPQNICEICSPYFASAITGQGASTGPAEQFPSLGPMPQIFSGGSGTMLGYAEFDVSVRGQTELSVELPGAADTNAITGMAAAGQQRLSQDNPNAIIDGSDFSETIQECSPWNHQPEPKPPGSVSPPIGGDGFGPLPGVDWPGWPGPGAPGEPSGPLPTTPGDFPEEPAEEPPDGGIGGIGVGEGLPPVPEPGEEEPPLPEIPGVPVDTGKMGCLSNLDCELGFKCVAGRCEPVTSKDQIDTGDTGVDAAGTMEYSSFPESGVSFDYQITGCGFGEYDPRFNLCIPPANMQNPINQYEQFDVYDDKSWVKGNFADVCIGQEVLAYCSEKYHSPDYASQYWSPFTLIQAQQSQGGMSAITGGVVSNKISGAAASGTCGGADYNCGTGIGTPSSSSDSVNHLSMMNNALGANEHCKQGMIYCYPCPMEYQPRKTPVPEQPENPTLGEDDPGCGWVHYCGVDGDLHTLFSGQDGISSPEGFIVPPMDPFKILGYGGFVQPISNFFTYLKNSLTGSAVVTGDVPEADVLDAINQISSNIYENQISANEFCVEKEGVCGPDGRCMPLCPEIPGPPEPEPPEPPGPIPGPPPQPPGPTPIPPAPTPPGPAPPPDLDDAVDTTKIKNMPNFCTVVTWQRKNDSVSASDAGLSAVIPSGYDLIGGPVQFDCAGDDMDIKFNVPDNYKDIKAFRCKDKDCTAVADVNVFIDELICDGIPMSQYRREELLSGDTFLSPDEITVIRKEKVLVSPEKNVLSSEGYVFELIGNTNYVSDAALYSPDFYVPLAANPSITIISTPAVIEFDKTVPAGINARITMPYKFTEGIDEDSISIYLLQGSQWIRLDSTVDKENKLVSAYLYDVAKYVQDNKLVFAVMAVKCEACIVSKFKNVYDPGSRDAIILVHGLTSSSKTWQFLIDDYVFNKQPWQVWTFDYPSKMTVDEMAKDLADSLQSNNAKYDNVYIIGHSLGGFIGQRALEIADDNRAVYTFLPKVRKVVLAGNPGLGSPAAEVYKNLVDEMINIKSMAKLFDVNAEVLDDLIKGRTFTMIPGVDYFVVVGSQSYEFNLGLFKVTAEQLFDLFDVNDGIITTKSASFVGGEFLDNACMNYFEVKLTHTELIDASIPRRIIERIISEEKARADPDAPYLGYNKYVDLIVEYCSPEEYFIVVGKKISELETPAPLLCNCGNGICGEDESPETCPQDCGGMYSLASFCMMMPLWILLLLFLLLVLTFMYVMRKRVKKQEVSHLWKGALIFLILLILLLLLLLYFICSAFPLISWGIWLFLAGVAILDAWIPVEAKR